MDHERPEQAFFDRMGLHRNMSLPGAVADFYALEMMAHEGSPRAADGLDALELKLGREFSTYLDMAIGGELRHAAMQKHRGLGIEYADMHLSRFLMLCEDMYDDDNDGIPRRDAWKLWMRMRHDNPRGTLDWLPEAARLFVDEAWDHDRIRQQWGSGGPGWATAAEVLYDHLRKVIKPRTFVDRCFTLEHNYGCILDKVYDTEEVALALELQHEGNYDQLVFEYASPAVVKAWTNHKMLKTTAQGKKYLAGQVEYAAREADYREMMSQFGKPEEVTN